jgi:hypothetical protein
VNVIVLDFGSWRQWCLRRIRCALHPPGNAAMSTM